MSWKIVETLLGGTLVVTGGIIEIGSFGTLTVAVGFQEAAGLSLLGHGFAQAMINSRDISFSSSRSIESPIDTTMWENVTEESQKDKKKSEENLPPYSGDKLGNNPTKSPGKGFEWRGKGSPESGKGSWINNEAGHKLHPDLNHPAPKKPHWDYKGPEGEARLNTDGTWEWK